MTYQIVKESLVQGWPQVWKSITTHVLPSSPQNTVTSWSSSLPRRSIISKSCSVSFWEKYWFHFFYFLSLFFVLLVFWSLWLWLFWIDHTHSTWSSFRISIPCISDYQSQSSWNELLFSDLAEKEKNGYIVPETFFPHLFYLSVADVIRWLFNRSSLVVTTLSTPVRFSRVPST